MIRQTIQGIIFDLDGVLIDSTACHRAAFNTVFARYGINDFDYAAHAGRRTPDVIADLFRRAGLPSDPAIIADAARDKSRRARQLLAAHKPLAEGCPGVLGELVSRYCLALATSGSRASLEAFLDLAACRSLFRSVLSGEDVTHAKPHPEIYRRTVDVLGVHPTACVVVEDAVAGVQAACQVGATVIGFEGTCTGEALHNAGAARIIRRLPELPALLSAL